MSWISVIAGLVCAGVAAVVVGLALRGRTRETSHYALLWLVLAGLLFAGVQQFVTPPLQARYDASRVDESLSSHAAFAAIKKHDPQTYARIMAELREGLLAGQSQGVLIERVRSQVTSLVQQRLPRASDEAATEYVRVMVQEMQELRSHGGELCHRFLFPQPGDSLNLTRYVSANLRDADAAALSQVVRSSTLSPQAVPQKAEVLPRMQPVMTALSARHGADLALLERPQAPGIDRDKLCAINIDLYSVILQMPPTDGGKLIRYLMSQG
jgi:hypothetical protein